MNSYLIKAPVMLDSKFVHSNNNYIGVENGTIDYIGNEKPKKTYSGYIDGTGYLVAPAFYNAHAHSAMTLLRGIGEDLPLSRWLNEKIFPYEAKLTQDDIYYGTSLACAEMLKYGTVGCNDMYFMGGKMREAYRDAGIKANISMSVVGFDEELRFTDTAQYNEYEELFKTSESDDIVKTDLSIHAEYTSKPRLVHDVAEYAAKRNVGIHLHLSETLNEHNECIQRHGMTPASYFEKAGVFNGRTIAAHCVHTDENDFDILKENHVFIASCPQSNLKLGSGVFKYKQGYKNKMNLALGTDGAASNNSLNMLKEARLAALLGKGVAMDAEAVKTADVLRSATYAGALSQGYNDCGLIKTGFKADLAFYPLGCVNMTPYRDAATALLYSSDGIAEIVMCNGRILYEKGEYKTIDIEKVKHYVNSKQ